MDALCVSGAVNTLGFVWNFYAPCTNFHSFCLVPHCSGVCLYAATGDSAEQRHQPPQCSFLATLEHRLQRGLHSAASAGELPPHHRQKHAASAVGTL